MYSGLAWKIALLYFGSVALAVGERNAEALLHSITCSSFTLSHDAVHIDARHWKIASNTAALQRV